MTFNEGKLAGEARSADEVMEAYRQYRSRLNPVLARLLVPDPEDIYRWRVQYDCRPSLSLTPDADDAHFITSFVYSGARGRQPGTVTSTTKLVLSHKHPDDYRYVRSPVSRWFVRSDPAVVDYRIDHTHGLAVESLSGDPHIDDDVVIGSHRVHSAPA